MTENPNDLNEPLTPRGRLFFNLDGIPRAGWSILIFIAFTALLMALFGMAAQMLVRAFVLPPHAVPAMLIRNTASVLAVYLSMLIVARFEQRGIGAYNLAGFAHGGRFVIGLVCGFAALSALIATLFAGHWLGFEPQALHGFSALGYGALWGLFFLGTGLLEEGIFRCFLLAELTRGIGYWPAVAVSSLLFSAMHLGNPGENALGFLSIVLIGFAFAFSVRVTGSAWWAIGFHSAWDWAETYFYGTADSGLKPEGHLLSTHPVGAALWSGGTVGPEGSLLIVPTILLVAAALFLADRQRLARVS